MVIRKLPLVCLVILSLAFPVEVLGALNNFKPGSEPDGFRGIRWGADISTLKDMECIETGEGGLSKFYKRRGDDLKIGAAQLKKVVYEFWDGKFAFVLIETDGYSNYVHLKEAVFEKFGVGARTEAKERLDIQEFVWNGAMTTMSLDYNQIRQEGNFCLWSKEMHEKEELWKRQKAREGARGGF